MEPNCGEFIDGNVLNIDVGKPDTTLTFRDYCDNIRTVVFRGVADVIVIDDAECQTIVRTRSKREGPLERMRLLNDDLKPIIDVLFESVHVQQ